MVTSVCEYVTEFMGPMTAIMSIGIKWSTLRGCCHTLACWPPLMCKCEPTPLRYLLEYDPLFEAHLLHLYYSAAAVRVEPGCRTNTKAR